MGSVVCAVGRMCGVCVCVCVSVVDFSMFNCFFLYINDDDYWLDFDDDDD